MLLADNFHGHSSENPLRNWLIYIRMVNDESDRAKRSSTMVRMLDAGVLIMVFFFFFTTLLSFWLATLSMQEHYEKAAVADMEEAR